MKLYLIRRTTHRERSIEVTMSRKLSFIKTISAASAATSEKRVKKWDQKMVSSINGIRYTGTCRDPDSRSTDPNPDFIIKYFQSPKIFGAHAQFILYFSIIPKLQIEIFDDGLPRFLRCPYIRTNIIFEFKIIQNKISTLRAQSWVRGRRILKK